jgi:hypothetical protein
MTKGSKRRGKDMINGVRNALEEGAGTFRVGVSLSWLYARVAHDVGNGCQFGVWLRWAEVDFPIFELRDFQSDELNCIFWVFNFLSLSCRR